MPVTMGLYGEPGSGKTEFARPLFAEFGDDRIAIVSSERGLVTLGNLGRARVFEIMSESDMAAAEGDGAQALAAELSGKVLKALNVAYKKIAAEQRNLAWWFLDGYSTVSHLLLRFLDDKLKKGEFTNNQGDPDIRKMYADVASRLGAPVNLFQALPLNGLINCRVEWEYEWKPINVELAGGKWIEKEKRTGKRWLAPALAGRKVGADFAANWDALLHLLVKHEPVKAPDGKPIVWPNGKDASNRVFWAQTSKTDQADAKIRTFEPVPTFIRLGGRQHDGERLTQAGDWDIVRLYRTIIGKEGI